MQTKSKGFTLIELLAVTAIIGGLAGLLLTTLKSAKESTKNTACRSNQRRLATNLIIFDEEKKKTPEERTRLRDELINASKGRTWPDPDLGDAGYQFAEGLN